MDIRLAHSRELMRSFVNTDKNTEAWLLDIPQKSESHRKKIVTTGII
jgi:hypothetical protein